MKKMPYGLSGEYNKYRKVGKKDGEGSYRIWKKRITCKYLNCSADDKVDIEKYLNSKLRRANHMKDFIGAIFIPLIVLIMSIYMSWGAQIYNTGTTYNTARNDIYNLEYRGIEKDIEEIQEKIESGEWEDYKEDLELQKAVFYGKLRLLNTKQTEFIKDSTNEINIKILNLNGIIAITLILFGGIFAWLYFFLEEQKDFYIDYIEIIHNMCE